MPPADWRKSMNTCQTHQGTSQTGDQTHTETQTMSPAERQSAATNHYPPHSQ